MTTVSTSQNDPDPTLLPDVEEDALETSGTPETAAVYAAPDEATAGIVRGMLEAEGIPALVGEQVADAYRGPLSVGEGYYSEILVPATMADAARALIEEYEAGQGVVSEAELQAQAEAAFDPRV